MTLETSTWQLAAASIAHKQDLLAYAEARGVKVAHRLLGYHTDPDLFISWISPGIGLGSLPKRHESHATSFVTVAEFYAACNDHATSQHQALPNEIL